MMPAMRAVASTSPFLAVPVEDEVEGFGQHLDDCALAVALRVVTSLPDTSTMRAAPRSSRWVRRLMVWSV